MRENKLLSVIAPAKNEEENIEALCAAVRAAMDGENIPFEFIIVDDGSTDGTYEAIRREARADGRIRGISLSRNFGKEGAVFAGLSRAAGGCAAVIDADLQFPPAAAARMYRLWENGADIVEGKKNSRGRESLGYKIFTKGFYGLLKALSGIDLNNASDFKLLDRRVMEALEQLPEKRTFFRAMTGWVGYKTEVLGFDVAPRHAGTTKWSPKALVRYALDSIAAYTGAPLLLGFFIGVFELFAALVLGLVSIFVNFPDPRGAYFTGGAAALLLVGGVITALLGVIGFYISKIYDEVKARPRFIIGRETARERDE